MRALPDKSRQTHMAVEPFYWTFFEFFCSQDFRGHFCQSAPGAHGKAAAMCPGHYELDKSANSSRCFTGHDAEHRLSFA